MKKKLFLILFVILTTSIQITNAGIGVPGNIYISYGKCSELEYKKTGLIKEYGDLKCFDINTDLDINDFDGPSGYYNFFRAEKENIFGIKTFFEDDVLKFIKNLDFDELGNIKTKRLDNIIFSFGESIDNITFNEESYFIEYNTGFNIHFKNHILGKKVEDFISKNNLELKEEVDLYIESTKKSLEGKDDLQKKEYYEELQNSLLKENNINISDVEDLNLEQKKDLYIYYKLELIINKLISNIVNINCIYEESKEDDNHIGRFEYSPNGKDYIYSANKDGKTLLIKDKCIEKGQTLTEKLNSSKKNLENSIYKNYIQKIDAIIEKSSEEKLKSVLGKINNIDLNNTKFKKYRDLLEYFEFKIIIELETLEKRKKYLIKKTEELGIY